jgi:hypothetical protein
VGTAVELGRLAEPVAAPTCPQADRAMTVTNPNVSSERYMVVQENYPRW